MRQPLVDQLHDAAAEVVRELEAGRDADTALAEVSERWGVPAKVIAAYVVHCHDHGFVPVLPEGGNA